MEHRRFNDGFRNLIAWKESHALTLSIYRHTIQFPSTERFGITSQLRRAASSIAAQLAEGSRMKTGPHKGIYYERAYASAAEVDNFLELAFDLDYLPRESYDERLKQVNRVSYLIKKLSDSLNI